MPFHAIPWPFSERKCDANIQNQNAAFHASSYPNSKPRLITQPTLVLVGTVDVTAESVNATDNAILADSAGGQSPGDSSAVVTDAEGIGADADESTVLGAGDAVR
jgi:hypothetical protein